MSGSSLKEPLLEKSSDLHEMDALMKEFQSWDPFSNTPFIGHTGAVWCCLISSNNEFLYSGSEDKTVKKWDVRSQSLIHTFTDHDATVNGLALIKNDKNLISGDWNGKIYVYNTQTHERITELQGHTSGVYCFVISQDRYLVSGSGDYTAKVWDLDNFSLVSSLSCDGNSVFSAAVTKNFTQVICGGWDGLIRVFDTDGYNMTRSWDGEAGVIQSMGLTSDDKFLIIGTRNNKIKVYNYSDNTEYCLFSSHENWVRNLVITHDDQYFISVSADKSIRVFNILEKTEELCLEGSEGYVFGESLSKDGRFLVTGASDKIVRIWKIGSRERVKNLKGHQKTIMSLVLTADDKFAVTGSEDKTVRVWSLESFEQVSELHGHTETVSAVAVSNNRRYIASGSGDKNVILWNFETKTSEATLSGHESPIFCVTFSHDNKFVVTGAQDKNLIVWNAEEKSLVKTLEGHTDTVFTAKITYDNRFIISGAADYTIRIWDLHNLIQVQKFETKAGMIESVSLSPDGKFLAFGDRASKVNLWDWSSKTLIKKFHSHSLWVKSVSFAKDSKLFLSSSNDKTIRVWNALEERAEIILKGHKGNVRSAVFTNDSRFVVSCGEDTIVKIWDLESEVLGLSDVVSSLSSFIYFSKIKKKESPSIEQTKATFSKIRVNLAHIYCYLGEEKLLVDALEKGVQIQVDLTGNSPLHYALQRNTQNCADAILRYMISLKDENEDLFLNYANALRNDFDHLLRNSSVCLPDFLDSLFYSVPNLTNFAVPKTTLPILNFSESKKFKLANFISTEGSGQEEVPIEFKTLPFAISVISGSKDSIELISSIVECPNQLILQSTIIKSYIRNKWNSVWPFILFLTLLFWANLVLMVTCIVFLYASGYSTVNATEISMILFAFACVNIFLSAYEVFQAFCTGLSYFTEFWNSIDILRSMFCLLWAYFSFSYSQKDLFLVTWIMCLLNMFRGLTGFRAFDSTRFYTRLIFRAFNDSISFILIFFYSTFAFGVIHFVSMEGSETDVFTLWRSPYQLNMGEIGDVNSDNPVVYIYFMLATLINVIIMLNLLISILGDAFDSFQMEAMQIDVLEMAELVLEIEYLMFWKRGDNNKMYVQVCQDLEGEGNQEWEGRIKALLNSVKVLKNESNKEFKNINSKLDKILSAVNKA